MGFYAAYVGGVCLPTFRDILPFPYSRIKQLKKIGRTGCHKTSAENNKPALRDITEQLRPQIRRDGILNSLASYRLSKQKLKKPE
jgi:hypothetical protein